MEKTHFAATKKGSLISRYKYLIVGTNSRVYLIYYECCLLLSVIPGAFGLFIRKVFWPRLFKSCGANVQFGSGIVLRHPNRVILGNRVIISEGCIIDVRNDQSENAVVIEDDVILSNFVTVSCKGGLIRIGARTGLNSQTIVSSVGNNPVNIGSDIAIGPRCYIVGGGDYNTSRLDIPIWRQGKKNDGGVIIEDDVWLGYNAAVLGGVKIETGSIIGAGAIVTNSIPARAVCVGQPAKILKYR